jgi:hypothetical protein
MQGSTAAAITCGVCGRRFALKPEYLGRKLKCKCGHVLSASPSASPSVSTPTTPRAPAPAPPPLAAIAKHSTAPAKPPPPPAAEDDGTYDIVPDPAPARPAQVTAHPAPFPAPVASEGGIGLTPAAAAAVLPYRGMVRRRPEETAELAKHQVREFILPSGLIAVGLLLTFVEARLFLGNWNPIALVAYVGITTVINLAMIFAALLLTARLLDLGLGEIGPALLKIAAVAILPSAVGGIIREGLSPFGGYLAFGVTIVAYWFLLWLHFEMDFQEMTICTAIIWVIRTWLGMLVFMAVFHLMFSGAGAMNGGGPAGFGPGGNPAPAFTMPGSASPNAPGINPGQPTRPGGGSAAKDAEESDEEQ